MKPIIILAILFLSGCDYTPSEIAKPKPVTKQEPPVSNNPGLNDYMRNVNQPRHRDIVPRKQWGDDL